MMASETTPETVAERVNAHYAAAWEGQRDLVARDWDGALGAAAALEQLADVLGVAFTEDRRRHLPRQLR